MPSNNWIQMEAAVRNNQFDEASDQLNSLAMFEMLPALKKLNAPTRENLVKWATQMLKGRGWTGASERIRWAGELVDRKAFPGWTPTDLGQDQIQDANRFLSTTDDHLRILFYHGAFQFTSENARILFQKAMNNEKVDGRVAEHTPQLQHLLIKLASASVTIMRTFVPEGGNSPHGAASGKKFVCSAVDVAWYAGYQFLDSVPRARLIEGVKRLLMDLPFGVSYDVGFVRPVGGEFGYGGWPGPYNPSLDVFFPVPPTRVAAAFKPDKSWGWHTMLKEVRLEVEHAAAGKVNNVYPDGNNHIHIKAY